MSYPIFGPTTSPCMQPSWKGLKSRSALATWHAPWWYVSGALVACPVVVRAYITTDDFIELEDALQGLSGGQFDASGPCTSSEIEIVDLLQRVLYCGNGCVLRRSWSTPLDDCDRL